MKKAKAVAPRRKTRAIAEVASRPPSASELVEALFSVPEISQELQQESFTRADIELALDDRGWLSPNARTFQELDPATRNIKIAQSRMYWTADPLAKQAVRLWTDYALGNGLTYHCDEENTQKQLDGFMKDRRNRRLTSSRGQRRSSHKLLIDGDLFFIFFRAGEDTPLMRYLDAIQIQEIITADHDQEQILGYKRTDAQGKNLYYKDWTAEEDDLANVKDPQTKELITWETDKNPIVYHLAFDELDKRGNGLLSTALPWTREHRRFMEARVALTQALSKFAWKLTAKVGEKGIQAISNRLQSSLSTTGFTGSPERNPPSAPASTFASNAGVDMTPMPRATGAGDATGDSNQLKLMVCAATGIFLHYFGDPSTGNLATATAMELPMLKMFSAYQQLLQDAWRDVFSIVLQEDPDEEPAEISIDMPPILSDDVGELGDFIMKTLDKFPEMHIPQVRRLLLTSMNIPDVKEAMDAADELQNKNEAKDAADAHAEQERLKAQHNQPPPAPVPQPVMPQEAIEAFRGFSEGIDRLVVMFESRQRQLHESESSDHHRKLEHLAEKEDESIKVLTRLCEALEKDTGPLISDAALARLEKEPISVVVNNAPPEVRVEPRITVQRPVVNIAPAEVKLSPTINVESAKITVEPAQVNVSPEIKLEIDSRATAPGKRTVIARRLTDGSMKMEVEESGEKS